MHSEVRAANAAGIIEHHEAGTGFYLAPARPHSGGRYYPGAFPARVRVDDGPPQDVAGPSVFRLGRPFRKLRVEGVHPHSHWNIVTLAPGEHFEPGSPQRVTFDVLDGLGRPRQLSGWHGDLESGTPSNATDGYAVLPNWKGLQLVVDWGGDAPPRTITVYWYDGRRWIRTEDIPGSQDAPWNNLAEHYREVVFPGGRVYFADHSQLISAGMALYAVAEVG